MNAWSTGVPQLEDAISFVINRYRTLAPLEEQDEAVFRSIEGPLETMQRAQEFITEGASVCSPRFVIEGWACRTRLLGDGRRKIVMFLLPGDAIGVCDRAHPLAMCSANAITQCRVLHASPAFDQPGKWSPTHPKLAEALRVAAALDENYLIDHIVRLGRQTALERMSHLLLELYWRLSQVGLARDWTFIAPLTQEVLADATGLSIVHVNRTIQHLRREAMLEWRHQTVTIGDPKKMAEIAEYKPPQIDAWA